IRVPFAEVGLVQVPDDGEPDERYLYLSDVLPTAWQAVEYAGSLPGEALAVIGLGPIGQMAARVALQRGVETVIGLDLVPERIATARRFGVTALNVSQIDDVGAAVRDLTGGRGPDAVIDAVGMEAHGSPGAKALQTAAGVLPDAMATSVFTSAGIDRLAALHLAIELVRRGGTVSISGVYGGAIDPMPMLSLFDKQVTMRMGQANVHRWISDLLPLVTDPGDPLNVLDLATHRLSLEEAPHGYDIFQHKTDGALKIVLDPWLSGVNNEVEEP
ncbi:MAG TPA: zinc-binding dehydrogenase, partial [Actinomycetales bacterium]|nr:zinc-binding dehydrogenase [Actinomycetales bacterium]